MARASRAKRAAAVEPAEVGEFRALLASEGTALERVERARDLRARLWELELLAMAEARNAGASWGDLGAAAGVTRAAARKRVLGG